MRSFGMCSCEDCLVLRNMLAWHLESGVNMPRVKEELPAGGWICMISALQRITGLEKERISESAAFRDLYDAACCYELFIQFMLQPHGILDGKHI